MKANPVFSLYIPTKLIFGCGKSISYQVKNYRERKHWLLFLPELPCGNMDICKKVLAQLRLNHVETVVYDKILPNPSKNM